MHPSGYQEVLVHTPEELVNVDQKTQAIRIAHSVGTRKRIQIASIASEREIHVLNPLVKREAKEKEIIEEEMPEDLVQELEEKEEKAEAKKKPKRSKGSNRAKEMKSDEP